jgi:hypothetical protein
MSGLKQYDLCKPVNDLVGNGPYSGVIAATSNVVILSIEGTNALVSREGNYRDSITIPLSQLQPIRNNK